MSSEEHFIVSILTFFCAIGVMATAVITAAATNPKLMVPNMSTAGLVVIAAVLFFHAVYHIRKA